MTRIDPDVWRRLAELAATTRGIVHVGDASKQVGIPVRTLQRHAAQRGWWRPFHGVAGLPGCPRDRLGFTQAAVLAVGRPVAASRWTAVAVLGLRNRIPARVQLIVPHSRKSEVAGVEVVRSRRVRFPRDLAATEGLPVLRPLPLLIDLAAVASEDALRSLAIDMRQQRMLDLPSAIADLTTRRPGAGSGRLRRVLDQLASAPYDSDFERLVAERLHRSGIDVTRQYRLEAHGRTLSIDLAIVDHRIAIECDGFGSHSTRAQLDGDHRRVNAITLAAPDWRLLRIGWDRFTQDWDGFLAELGAALRPVATPAAQSPARRLAVDD